MKIPSQHVPDDIIKKRITNLSNYALSNIEKESLYNGLEFCVPPKQIKQYIIDGEFECLFDQTKDLVPTCDMAVSTLKARLVNFARNYPKLHSSHSSSFFSATHLNAVESLRKNPDIIITKPDKGRGVVIMNRDDYINKKK
jgi:hypothetical protein